MNKNKKMRFKLFKGFLILLFITFLFLYFAEESGYYEFKNHRTKELTDKQIRKFENDIAEGKNVKLEDYVITKDTSYANNLSSAGLKISNGISHLVESGLNKTFSVVVKLIEE